MVTLACCSRRSLPQQSGRFGVGIDRQNLQQRIDEGLAAKRIAGVWAR